MNEQVKNVMMNYPIDSIPTHNIKYKINKKIFLNINLKS